MHKNTVYIFINIIVKISGKKFYVIKYIIEFLLFNQAIFGNRYEEWFWKFLEKSEAIIIA